MLEDLLKIIIRCARQKKYPAATTQGLQTIQMLLETLLVSGA